MIQIIAKLDEIISHIYIEYELIIPFQLQLKSLTHVISQKTSIQVFYSKEHKCVEKKQLVQNLFSFER
jgi:hypothetical protein